MIGILRVTAGPDAGRIFSVVEGFSLVLGRGDDTESRLRDPQVSRKHCRVQLKSGKAVVADNGSSTGTLVNGARVTEREIKPGDVLRIGETEFSFEWSNIDEKSTEGLDPAAPPQ